MHKLITNISVSIFTSLSENSTFIETFNTNLIFSNKQSKNILSLHVSVSLVESGRVEAAMDSFVMLFVLDWRSSNIK